ncbi:hypothetical protein [Streptomyces roseus]|uniref:DUF4276 domain-containing protein n=1 Tax=Streptomyces roseus TaxID=66430 RepID=A0A0J6XHM9_9ACTN|nr:hypothetical protein [Streptomyces roseus]KMO94153.1 hypothetical protein ACS04_30940 [Streptomyces roseus]
MTYKYRPLTPGLLVEGSDGPYLASLVKRQLDRLIRERSSQTVEVLGCAVSPVRTNDKPERVLRAAEELARDCDVVFVHGDEDARDERLKLVAELEQRRGLAPRAGVSVPLVPVLMTESWMLADRKALERVIGAEPLKAYPYTAPSALEGHVTMKGSKDKRNPKQVWKALLGADGREVLSDRAELLVRWTDLDVLGQLPSYRKWCEDTARALRTLNFL